MAGQAMVPEPHVSKPDTGRRGREEATLLRNTRDYVLCLASTVTEGGPSGGRLNGSRRHGDGPSGSKTSATSVLSGPR